MAHNQKKKIIFLGYITPILKKLFIKKNVKILGVGIEKKNLISSEIQKFCEHKNLYYFDAKRINNNKEFYKLTKIADIIIVAAFSQLINISKIPRFKNRILNFHPSLLPMYRGGSPIEEQILKGEVIGGITFHWMREKFDDGPIVAQKKIRIKKNDDYKSLLKKYVKLGVLEIDKLFDDDIEKWKVQKLRLKSSMFLSRKETDAIINFRNTYNEIDRVMRAFNWRMWPHIIYKNKIYKVKKISKSKNVRNAKIGEVIKIKPQLKIKCRDSVLAIDCKSLGKVLRENTNLLKNLR